MESKHTAGPWYVRSDPTPDYAPQYTVYADESGDRVATVFGSKADTALIAAAPAMYAVLDRLLNDGDLDDREAWRITDDVLRLARGEWA